MIKSIHSILIAVRNLDVSVSQYEALLGKKATYAMELDAETTMARFSYRREELESLGFDRHSEVAYFNLLSGSMIVLIASSDENSVVGKFLSRSGEGIMKVSLEVDDVHAEVERIRRKGHTILLKENAIGTFGEANFVHPNSMSGVQFEIIRPEGVYVSPRL